MNLRFSNHIVVLGGLIIALLLISRYNARRMSNYSPAYHVEVDDYNDFPEWSNRPSLRIDLNPEEVDEDVVVDALVRQARRVADSGSVVLLYASFSYRQPLLNWLVATKRARGTATKGILLVCLDDGLKELIERLGWTCYLEKVVKSAAAETSTSEQSGSLNKDTVKSLWVTRVEHVERLIAAGLNVILSDTDAIWLKDPLAQLLKPEYGDVIASRANFPYNSPWGATLCMGFIIFRATPQVVRLTQLALEETKLTLDDQIGFNNVLFRLSFDDTSGKKLAFGRKLNPSGTSAARATFYVDDLPLKVTLLQHTWVARYCGMVPSEIWASELLVAHCHVNEGKPAPTNKHKGNQDTHTAILEKYNAYFLNSDWDAIISEATSKDAPDFEAVIESLDATKV